MVIEFKLTDDDGTVLTQAREEIARNFSMHEFLNKTVPGWEATVRQFFDRNKEGGYDLAFQPPAGENAPSEESLAQANPATTVASPTTPPTQNPTQGVAFGSAPGQGAAVPSTEGK